MKNTFANQLRKNQTPPEKLLWGCLRNHRILGVGFRRQHPIDSYIVDFFCIEKKLIIEIDGEVHSMEQLIESDLRRQQYLEFRGFRVLRFTAKSVMENLEGVVKAIELEIAKL